MLWVFSSEKKGGRCDRVRRSVVHLVVKRPMIPSGSHKWTAALSPREVKLVPRHRSMHHKSMKRSTLGVWKGSPEELEGQRDIGEEKPAS